MVECRPLSRSVVERGEIRAVSAKTLVLTLIAIVLSRGSLRRVFPGDATNLDALFSTYSEFCMAETAADDLRSVSSD